METLMRKRHRLDLSGITGNVTITGKVTGSSAKTGAAYEYGLHRLRNSFNSENVGF